MAPNNDSAAPSNATATEAAPEDFKDCTPSIEYVACQLPQFWADDPATWFGQVEAQFKLSGIKLESTKFYHVVAKLDSKYAREIKDIIENPPATEMYQKLKSELLKRLSVSREQQIRQLLTQEELGDRKPTQFLRHLRTLAGGGVADEFLRSLWSSRLPTHVQAIIASQTGTTLNDVAELADKIMEVASSPLHQVASTSTFSFDSMLNRLEEMISTRIKTEMTQQIAQLTGRQPRGRGRSPFYRDTSRSKSRGRSRSRTPGMCWYHDIFGDKAKKCRQPCNYKSENWHGSQ